MMRKLLYQDKNQIQLLMVMRIRRRSVSVERLEYSGKFQIATDMIT